MRVGVLVGKGVFDGVNVRLGVLLGTVAVLVLVAVGVLVDVSVDVDVLVAVEVEVAVWVGVSDGVGVSVGVGVSEGVGVCVLVGVFVMDGVLEGVLDANSPLEFTGMSRETRKFSTRPLRAATKWKDRQSIVPAVNKEAIPQTGVTKGSLKSTRIKTAWPGIPGDSVGTPAKVEQVA